MKRISFQNGVRDGVPIALGYFAVSFTFGMAAVTGGLSVGQAVLISFTNLTSAGQFAGLDIILAGGAYWEMALAQLVINLRYSLMSFSISQKLGKDESVHHRFFMAYGMTDEIFAIGASRAGKISPYYQYGAMSVAVPGWTLGTLAGAVLGNILPAFLTSALGIAIYGMFLAIIIPTAKKNRAVFGVVLGAMLLSWFFQVLPVVRNVSSGFAIIISTVFVAGMAAYLCPVKEAAHEA